MVSIPFYAIFLRHFAQRHKNHKKAKIYHFFALCENYTNIKKVCKNC